MTNLRQALWAETLKARHSRLPLLTGLGFSLLPVVGGLFMIILRDPELARQAGLITAKAQLTAGTADWPSFLGLLTLGTAVAGLMIFSLAGSWVFGREFVDRTAKDLLALPTPRSAVVAAKFLVVAGWAAGLTVLVGLLGLLIGLALDLPQGSLAVIGRGLVVLVVTAALTLAAVVPILFFAGFGRGYLAPVGVTVLAIALAQVATIMGWGDAFPWAIAGLYAQDGLLSFGRLALVMVTAAAGAAGTFLWWGLADQTQ